MAYCLCEGECFAATFPSRRCRLSWMTDSHHRIWAQMRGFGGGGCGVSANFCFEAKRNEAKFKSIFWFFSRFFHCFSLFFPFFRFFHCFSLNFCFASIFSLNFRLFYLRFRFRFLVFRIEVNHVKSGFFFASKRNEIFASISNFASEAKVRAHPRWYRGRVIGWYHRDSGFKPGGKLGILLLFTSPFHNDLLIKIHG